MSEGKLPMRIPDVSCDTNTILALLDSKVKFGDSEGMRWRVIIEKLFSHDAERNGEHSAEFLRAYVSAIVFVLEWLKYRKAPPEVIDAITGIGTVVARRYNESAERQFLKAKQFGDATDPYAEIKRE